MNHESKNAELGTLCSVVVNSPLLMFLMGSEESNVKLAPAPCAYSDEIILLWISPSFGKGVRVGAGNWYRRNNQNKYTDNFNESP